MQHENIEFHQSQSGHFEIHSKNFPRSRPSNQQKEKSDSQNKKQNGKILNTQNKRTQSEFLCGKEDITMSSKTDSQKYESLNQVPSFEIQSLCKALELLKLKFNSTLEKIESYFFQIQGLTFLNVPTTYERFLTSFTQELVLGLESTFKDALYGTFLMNLYSLSKKLDQQKGQQGQFRRYPQANIEKFKRIFTKIYKHETEKVEKLESEGQKKSLIPPVSIPKEISNSLSTIQGNSTFSEKDLYIVYMSSNFFKTEQSPSNYEKNKHKKIYQAQPPSKFGQSENIKEIFQNNDHSLNASSVTIEEAENTLDSLSTLSKLDNEPTIPHQITELSKSKSSGGFPVKPENKFEIFQLSNFKKPPKVPVTNDVVPVLKNHFQKKKANTDNIPSMSVLELNQHR